MEAFGSKERLEQGVAVRVSLAQYQLSRQTGGV